MRAAVECCIMSNRAVGIVQVCLHLVRALPSPSKYCAFGQILRLKSENDSL